MSATIERMPGWRENLRNPKRWMRQIQRTLLWLAAGYAVIYALGMFVPGGLILVVTESIPRGLYWHDTRPFDLARGKFIRIQFNPSQSWIAERYARPVDYPQHVKTIGGLPGDLIVSNSKQDYFICKPQPAGQEHEIPVAGLMDREGMQCWSAGRPQDVDSQNRPMSGWLAASGEYRLKDGEVWTFAPHIRSMDSRYYGPLPIEKIVSKVTPLIQID